MDSNSGSMQSSSGDEEYDSRAADSSSISAFINPSSTHFGAMPNLPRPLPPHLHNTQITSSIFDQSLSGYSFDPLSRSLPNQNPLLNLDMLNWSKTLRSDPNYTDPPNILPSSSSPPFQPRSTSFRNSSPAAVQIPSLPENSVRSSAASSEQTSVTTAVGTVRNSKKRSRASRRAPTTVLTTDTTNFRAMVQEFTGIPAPPFTTSSPFPRTRLDLFSSSFMKSSHMMDPSSTTPSPPYLLRPFAQKIQPPPQQPPQPLPLPFVSSSNNTTTTAISTNMTSSTSTSINYQLPVIANSDLGQVNMHNNTMLSFQSLLQTSPKYPLPNSAAILGSSRQPNDEFGVGHGHVNPHLTALSNMEGTNLRRSNISTNNNSANWGGDGSNHNEVGDQGLMFRSVNGGIYGNPQQQQVTNGKGNYLAASSSSFHGDRGGSENVSSRSEGMVESWICTSD